MAYEKAIMDKDLVLELDGGVVEGKQRIVRRSYQLKADATDSGIHTTGEVLAGLQALPLMNVNTRTMENITWME